MSNQFRTVAAFICQSNVTFALVGVDVKLGQFEFGDTTAREIVDVETERLTFAQLSALKELQEYYSLDNAETIGDVVTLAHVDELIETAQLLVPGDLENAGFDSDDMLEVFEAIDGETDTTVDGVNGGDWRFIDGDELENVAYGEIIDGDEYTLGCFADWFIANAFEALTVDVVAALQKAEAYQELGELITRQSRDELEAFVSDYLSTDGNGHHFAHYDHNEYEFEFNGTTYHAFRTN